MQPLECILEYYEILLSYVSEPNMFRLNNQLHSYTIYCVVISDDISFSHYTPFIDSANPLIFVFIFTYCKSNVFNSLTYMTCCNILLGITAPQDLNCRLLGFWCLIHNAHLGKIVSFYKILGLKINREKKFSTIIFIEYIPLYSYINTQKKTVILYYKICLHCVRENFQNHC
jgi:hypothetical protein